MKKTVSIIVLSLLLMGILSFEIDIHPAKAGTIIVPDDHTTIQEALDHANSGDTIFVRSGTYYEHIIVNKTVSVIGENAGTTVIDGNDSGTVVGVTADNVSVSGFTIRNGEIGLDLLGDGGNVSANIFTSNGLVNTDLRTDLEVYQDPLGVIWHRHYDLIQGSYTELYQLTTETLILGVGVFGHADVEALMLGIFYDENMDGVPQLHEFLGFASVDLNTWVCVFGPPLGQYIIKVHGFAVSGNPGHFDRRITTYRGSGIAVHSSSNSIISGNVVGDNYAGIFIQSSTSLSVHLNNIMDNIGGIIASTSVNSFVSDNHVFSNDPDFGGGTGIALRDVRNTTVAGNLLSHNSFGVNVWNSSGINVEENQLEWHGGWAVELHGSVDNNVANNNITEVATLDGIRLMFSSRNNLTRNNLTNCEHSGILYWYDNFNNSATFNNLQFSGIHHYLDGHGVEIILSANNTFTLNTFANGNNQGFLALESNDNTITDNLVVSNRKGIVLRNSFENHVYHNSIINNLEQQGYDDTTQNYWSDGYPSGGNYWSDYDGRDMKNGPSQDQSGSDGIGDTPFTVAPNNQDKYPLMNPWNHILENGKTLNVTSNNQTYFIVTFGNTAIQNLSFYESLKQMSFNTTGTPGTIGYSRVVFPKDLINGTFAVLVNGTAVSYTKTENATHSFVYFTYHSGAAQVKIKLTKTWDITGPNKWAPDLKCDIRDVAQVALLFGSAINDQRYDDRADLTGPVYLVPDEKIDIRDIALVAKHFGETYT